MAHRKVYTPEFKQQAVQLAQQTGNTNQGIASDLGISQSALSSWIKAAKEHGSLAFPGQGVARLTPEQETIKRLERELVTLRQERNTQISRDLVCQGSNMIYPFVHAQRPQFPLRVFCRTMGVTESGYHSWRARPQKQAEDDAQFLAHIKTVHDDSKGRYGSPRVYRELRATGVRCSRHRVARLMRAAGRRGRGKRRFKSTTESGHALPVAENLLMRQFEVAEPNLVWAADMTFIRTTEGWLYLAVVQGLYSRKIVGWSMGSRMSADLPLAALRMAFHQRHPAPGLLHHSDRGSQYASQVYQHALQGMQMTCSMSRKGDCFDNAVVESFFASLKREECDGAAYPTRDIARQHVFAYLEQFYNRKRRHSYLGYVSPAEFEAQPPASLKRIA